MINLALKVLARTIDLFLSQVIIQGLTFSSSIAGVRPIRKQVLRSARTLLVAIFFP